VLAEVLAAQLDQPVEPVQRPVQLDDANAAGIELAPQPAQVVALLRGERGEHLRRRPAGERQVRPGGDRQRAEPGRGGRPGEGLQLGLDEPDDDRPDPPARRPVDDAGQQRRHQFRIVAGADRVGGQARIGAQQRGEPVRRRRRCGGVERLAVVVGGALEQPPVRVHRLADPGVDDGAAQADLGPGGPAGAEPPRRRLAAGPGEQVEPARIAGQRVAGAQPRPPGRHLALLLSCEQLACGHRRLRGHRR
jgi:hypothetical protein